MIASNIVVVFTALNKKMIYFCKPKPKPAVIDVLVDVIDIIEQLFRTLHKNFEDLPVLLLLIGLRLKIWVIDVSLIIVKASFY